MDLCCVGAENRAHHYRVAKWVYCFCFLLTILVTWLLRDYGESFLTNLGPFSYCKQPDGVVEALCSGKEAALRISFGNFIFFAVHMLILIGANSEEDDRTMLHTGLWCIKIPIWVGTIVGCFFIPSGALRVYGEIARVGSGFFLVLQLIELIHFVYLMNEYLLGVDKTWAVVTVIATSIITISAGIIMHGYAYYYFAPVHSCRLNMFFITWSLLLLFALVGVLFIPERTEIAGLLTSGAVFTYTSFLLLSALMSEPPSNCNRLSGTGGAGPLQIVSFFLALLTIAYGTLSTGTSDLVGSSPAPNSLPYRADMFHLCFALASMYTAMLFTNWQLSSSSERFVIDRGMISTWVKMVSKWLCELLYLWTVVAPVLMPDRQFG